MKSPEPQFRATLTGWLPITRRAWLLTLAVAVGTVVLIAAAMMIYVETNDARWIIGAGSVAFIAIVALFAWALPRTEWRR